MVKILYQNLHNDGRLDTQNTMKLDTLKKRLDKNRPMMDITLRLPEDVIEDLERLAPKLGFLGYLPLIKAYVGQSLRMDLERFEEDKVCKTETARDQ